MKHFEPGQIVLFYSQAQLRPGLLASVGERYCQVLDGSGQSLNLSTDRFILVSRVALASVTPAALNSWSQELQDCRDALDTEPMLAKLAGLSTPFEIDAACSELGYTDDLHRFALFLLLKDRADLFLYKKGLFKRRTEEERAVFLEQRNLENERAAYLQELAEFLAGVAAGKAPSLSAQTRNRFLAELRELQVAEGHRDLARLLRKASDGAETARQILDLRALLGDLDLETDPMAAGSGIPVLFTPDLWREARPSVTGEPIAVEAFSIDAADSPDHDDAISLQALPDGWEVGIHISDVAAQLALGSDLFREAQNRVSSLYLPSGSIPLLPSELSSQAFSLLESAPRAVLSLFVSLDQDLRPHRYEFRRATIRLARNLTYDEVDAQIAAKPYADLLRVCRKLQLERTGGANDHRQRYSWNLKVADGDMLMQRIDNLSPARFIVEELMILYNRIMAEQASSQDLPLIYRNIAQYFEPEDEEEAKFPGIQAYLSTEGKFHPGIGSQAYLHATSPIRRFADIVNQAQFESLLAGSPQPFSRNDLDEMIPVIEKRLLQLRAIAHRSERYWLLRFLRKKHLNSPLDAVLLKRLKHGFLTELTAWDKRIVLRCEDRPPLQTPVKLVIADVDLEELVVMGDVIL